MRTPLVIIGALVVVLLAVSVLTGSGGSASPAAEKPVAPVSVIAHRVETVRDLRYRTIPAAKAATPAQARADGLADFDRTYPVARRHADETMLTMLGLIPPGTSLRDVAASLYSEGVAGYYDPRTKRLRTVSGAATGTRVLAETVLAHELTHALEDQRFGLLDDADRVDADDDRALARLALVEGSATTVMQLYMARYFSPEEALAGTLASAFADTGDMPPFLQAQTVFPYIDGMRFVGFLRRRGGGSWSLVDTAEHFRPPASTEQVLHPERYLQADAPKPVRLGDVRFDADFTRIAAGTWGELQTRELLAAAGGGGESQAAAGWGGDRWALWRSADHAVLVMRWRWDTARDEREFAARLRSWVSDGRSSRPAGEQATVNEHAGAVTLFVRAPQLPPNG